MLRIALLALLALLLTAPAAPAQEPTPLPAPPGSEAEPNNDLATASPIAAGERIRARLAAGEADLYRFSATAGDRVFAATMTAGTSSASTDSRLALLAPDGETIESDNDNGHLWVDSSSIAGAAIPATGTYYLRVDSPRNAELRTYDLVLDVHSGAPAAEVEPNGDAQQAQDLAGARFVSGTREAGESDLYSFELGAGDTVLVSLDLDPERDGTAFNGRLGFGKPEMLVGLDDIGNSDGTPSEAFFGTVNSSGRYLVSVDSTPNQTGAYLLSITVIPAVERGCRTYSVEPADGAIPDMGAATFPIDVPDEATIDHVAVRVDLTHTFMQDLDATLEAPAGNRIAVFDDVGSNDAGQNTRMRTTLDENAGTPPLWEWLDGLGFQPERGTRLSWFEGQQAAGRWTLTFRDDAGEDVGNLARFDLILCARPEEGPVDTVFSAGFEDGDDGFTHSGAEDEWERGAPATPETPELAGLTGCAAGAGCFKTDLDGTYQRNSSQDLVSPPISLAGRSGPIYASWQMWHQLESASFEHLTVTVEEDGGANPRPLYTWSGADMTAIHGNPPVRIPVAAGWARHRADVSDYAGKTIRLRFHLDSDDTVQRRGVAIDDVRVYQPVPVAAADAYEVDEDTQLTVDAPGVLGNDGDGSTAALESGPEHGRLELNPDGSFTYTPDRDYNGTDSFSYRAVANGLESEPATVTIAVAAVEDTPSASAPGDVAPATVAAEPAISDLRLDSRCVRAKAGRVRVGMTMRAQPGDVQVRVDRAVGSGNRRSCPKANPERNQEFRRVATFRRVAKVRAQAAAVTRRVTLDLRLRPGLYRLTVRVGDSPPTRRFLRVIG